MFKIAPVEKKDIEYMTKYLNTSVNGIILACYEGGKITGGVCFDIDGGCGYLDSLKAEEEIMEEIILKAAMNFLELHKIYEFYVKEETPLYKRLDFKVSKKDGYKMFVNLDGYFDTHKCTG